jgi:rRNA maturation protein Nop10
MLKRTCSKCGTPNEYRMIRCRGCGGSMNVPLPRPRFITGTDRFGL